MTRPAAPHPVRTLNRRLSSPVMAAAHMSAALASGSPAQASRHTRKVKRPGEKEKLIRLCKVHREEKDVPPISEKSRSEKRSGYVAIHLKAMPQR